ncbi:MAG: hypothetical protein RXP77_04295 [Nitrososphaeria archaeon]
MQPGISLRMEAYRRPEVRDALSRILREGGAYSTDHPAEILRELSELGILREVARESWMRDPGTGATSFTLRPSCPYCGSFSLGKEDLLEHVGCGYVGRASEFMRDGGCAVCPRCGRPAEVRRIGSWFYCRSCGRSFHSPRIFASSGGKAIPAEDLELVEAARYELAPGIADEVRGVLSLYSRPPALVRVLRRAGQGDHGHLGRPARVRLRRARGGPDGTGGRNPGRERADAPGEPPGPRDQVPGCAQGLDAAPGARAEERPPQAAAPRLLPGLPPHGGGGGPRGGRGGAGRAGPPSESRMTIGSSAMDNGC